MKGNIAIDGKLTFCGGIDVAALLAKHNEEVRAIGVAFFISRITCVRVSATDGTSSWFWVLQ